MNLENFSYTSYSNNCKIPPSKICITYEKLDNFILQNLKSFQQGWQETAGGIMLSIQQTRPHGGGKSSEVEEPKPKNLQLKPHTQHTHQPKTS